MTYDYFNEMHDKLYSSKYENILKILFMYLVEYMKIFFPFVFSGRGRDWGFFSNSFNQIFFKQGESIYFCKHKSLFTMLSALYSCLTSVSSIM